MTADQYELAFKPVVRAWVNWRQLRREEPDVMTVVLVERGEIGALLLVGVDGAYDEADAKLRSVAETAAEIHAYADRAAVFTLAESYVNEAHGVSLAVPCATLERHVIALDGCHRLLALYLAGAEDWAVTIHAVPATAGLTIDAEYVPPPKVSGSRARAKQAKRSGRRR